MEGHLKKFKTRRDAYSALYLSIFVIKSPIEPVRQSLYVLEFYSKLIPVHYRLEVHGTLMLDDQTLPDPPPPPPTPNKIASPKLQLSPYFCV